MKRIAALCLSALVALTAGCAYSAVAAKQEEESYDLYFREADLDAASGGDALRTERIYLSDVPRDDPLQLAQALLSELLDGPRDETLRSPFPVGTTLLSLEVEGSRAKVDMSAAYGTLSGVALTMADYAVALTLTQLPEISVVSITVRGQELAYRSAQRFTARDVLFATTEDVVGTLPVTLYFPDGGGVLTPEVVTLELYEGDTQVGAVIKALEHGPAGKDLSAAFPEAFQVKSAWLEENVCYVNLSSAALPELTEPQRLMLAIRALVRSLCSLDAVEEVQFLVDGEFTGRYGAVPVGEPYTA